MTAYYTAADHFAILPALLLALFGCSILMLDFLVFAKPSQKKWLVVFVAIAEAFTAYALWRQGRTNGLTAFGGSVTIDGLALFFNWIFVAATLITALISYRYFADEDEHHGEYYGLLLLAQSGMFFLATGADLITMFTGLELVAITFYILVGFLRRDRRSNEAAMKYLLLGAFSSGFLVYGFSLLYGLSGSTKLAVIAQALAERPPGDAVTLLAVATTSVGLLFKIAAAPFHMWTPDAYEGAPAPVTAFLSTASKAASFALLLRVFLVGFAALRDIWTPILIVAAVLSLTVGNLGALLQPNIKRLLAYSSIAHAGYILLGVVAGNQTGLEGVLIYTVVYVFMNLGAFLVVIAMRRENLNDLAGLMHTNPAQAVMLLVFLVSLAGLPPTAGFIGKYYIFLALIEARQYWLAAIATVYVAVAAYFYFRVVRSMFTGAPVEGRTLAPSFGMRAATVVTGLATIAIGLYPEPVLRLAAGWLAR